MQHLVVDVPYVVYPGTRRCTLAQGVEALPLGALLTASAPAPG